MILGPFLLSYFHKAKAFHVLSMYYGPYIIATITSFWL